MKVAKETEFAPCSSPLWQETVQGQSSGSMDQGLNPHSLILSLVVPKGVNAPDAPHVQEDPGGDKVPEEPREVKGLVLPVD